MLYRLFVQYSMYGGAMEPTWTSEGTPLAVCGTSIILHKRVTYSLLGTLIQPDSFGALSHENN